MGSVTHFFRPEIRRTQADRLRRTGVLPFRAELKAGRGGGLAGSLLFRLALDLGEPETPSLALNLTQKTRSALTRLRRSIGTRIRLDPARGLDS